MGLPLPTPEVNLLPLHHLTSILSMILLLVHTWLTNSNSVQLCRLSNQLWLASWLRMDIKPNTLDKENLSRMHRLREVALISYRAAAPGSVW